MKLNLTIEVDVSPHEYEHYRCDDQTEAESAIEYAKDTIQDDGVASAAESWDWKLIDVEEVSDENS